MTNVCDDLNKKYIGRKLVIATELIKICGFGSVYDTETRERDEIVAGIRKHSRILIKKMTGICDVFGRAKRRRPDPKKWQFKSQLEFINSILIDVLQLKITPIKRHSTTYFIDGIDVFDFKPGKKTKETPKKKPICVTPNNKPKAKTRTSIAVCSGVPSLDTQPMMDFKR